ncbi:hypothetical protein BDV95DRAFT_102488 [Massariosphaeria phaeospora]|uniref:Uncharacterized protein n=1 Tax=Massariosphaeria phaeospora TaxID=100035 RepID=A0A7C8M606_9PLEO|nr:hypothetical protein BDV95DRAFT_102488 [Massariosphaeria phaeospora]
MRGVTHGGEICDRSCVHRSGCASPSQIRGRREEYKGLTCHRLPTARIVPWLVMSPTQLSAMNSSQGSDDSITTIEDNLYTMKVYLEGMKIQPDEPFACPQDGVLSQLGRESHGDKQGDRPCNKRVRFKDSDPDDGRPSVKRKVSPTVSYFTKVRTMEQVAHA